MLLPKQFQLTILFISLFSFLGIYQAQSQVNDECVNAILLPVNTTCNFVQYTNQGATASTGIQQPICGNYQGADVWFKVVVPANGGIELDGLPGTLTDGVMGLYTGNCGSLVLVACDDDGSVNGNMPFISHFGLPPGSTVYIRFWDYGGNDFGTFSICAKTATPPTNCSLANPGGCACPTTGATDCLLLPDIIAGKRSLNDNTGWAEYGQQAPAPNTGLLRVDVATPNVGWGPMEVVATNDYICGTDTLRNFFPPSNFECPDGSELKRLINQRIYHKVGNTFQYDVRPAGYMQYHPEHGHIHIDGWGLYTLRLRDASLTDTLQWPIVNSGVKVSFCLIDLTTCSSSLGNCVDAAGNVLTNNSFPNYGLGSGNYNCGNEMQGISVGKVDIYSRTLDESFVKIPYEACNGQYHLMIQIDPDNHFTEMNENNNWLVAKTPLTQQRTSNTNPYAYIFSKKGNVFCTGDSLVLEASGASSYTWSTGASSQKIVARQPGRYWVTATTPCGTTTSDTMDIFTAGPSAHPAVSKGDTVCRGVPAHLYASGNAHWYDAPTGGNLVYRGNDFTTPALNASVTYYVVDQAATLSGAMGPTATNFSGQGNNTGTRRDYLIFNAFQPFKLKTVTVNANIAGTVYIQLRDMYDNLLEEKVLTVTTGEQQIALDFSVPAGLNHQLGLRATGTIPQLYKSTTTATNIGFPYRLKNIGNIVGSNAGDREYPYFYNWQIDAAPLACNDGSRKAVTATMAPDFVPNINGLVPVYLHTDPPVTLLLSPGAGVLTGPGITGNMFSPSLAGVGNHDITYLFAFGNCARSTTVTTEVKFDSSVIQYDTDIKLFNNPGAQQQLFVSTNQAAPLEWRLTNMVGQLIRREKHTANRGNNIYPIDLSFLADGVYILQVNYGAGTMRKLFKVRNN